MNEKLIDEIRQALKDNSDRKTLEFSSRFFKKGEAALVYGVKTAEVRKIGKEFYTRLKGYSKQEIFDICEALQHLNK